MLATAHLRRNRFVDASAVALASYVSACVAVLLCEVLARGRRRGAGGPLQLVVTCGAALLCSHTGCLVLPRWSHRTYVIALS